MDTTSIVLLAATGLTALVALNPWLTRRDGWRATVTPLASIIGSGFLVAGPILADAAGIWALPAMMALCALALLFGSAIRFNIRQVEPKLDDDPPRWLSWSERGSELALLFAYFISVAYYLNLFAAFGLRIVDMTDPFRIRAISTGVIVLLGSIGLFRGLHWLENIELQSVGLKLALIGGLIAALIFADGRNWLDGSVDLPDLGGPSGRHDVQVLLGLVILVQGFETSRYLGHAYDADTRVRTMLRAQVIATMIYAAFIALVTPYFAGGLPEQGGETAIIGMLRPLSTLVAPLIIGIALASQLSAAVADMNGAGGLVDSAGKGKFGDKTGYAATALFAIGITWIANIYEIIVYATKAFVLYYGIQSATAAWLSRGGGGKGMVRMIVYGAAAVFALIVLVFGVPAEGGG